MVVVPVHLAAVQQFHAVNQQAVRRLLYLCAQPVQAVGHGCKQVAFFDAQTGGIVDAGAPLGKRGCGGQNGDQVGNLCGVDFHSV